VTDGAHRTRPTRRRFLRGFLVVSGAGLGLAALVGLASFVDPIGSRLMIFQPVRETRFFLTELGGPLAWREIDRVTLPEPEVVELPRGSDADLRIVADLYRPQHDERSLPAPALLLLHPSSPFGRRVGLVRLTGERLRARGWFVLAPDGRGYGDTADPPRPDDPGGWLVRDDVRRSIDWLSALPGVDPSRLFVLGHSFGANCALAGALDHPAVAALVLVGPARYPDGSRDESRRWERVRFSADRKLRHPVKPDALLAAVGEGDIELLSHGPLGEPGHTPVLLLDGALESDGDHRYLAQVARQIAPPIEYETLPEAGHYCGVYSFFGSRTVYYRPGVFEPFLDRVLRFFEAQAPATRPVT
jgi:pimeloyl-ACP methyl ester carboxylesterase